MKRPAEVRREVERARRHRRIAHLERRRPGSVRLAVLTMQCSLMDTTDRLAATLSPALRATVDAMRALEEQAAG